MLNSLLSTTHFGIKLDKTALRNSEMFKRVLQNEIWMFKNGFLDPSLSFPNNIDVVTNSGKTRLTLAQSSEPL